MQIKCPYCGCSYEINFDLLKDPIGNENLGYGWWLRCYKCQKKWWLKQSDVMKTAGVPLSADRRGKIDKILKLKGKAKRKTVIKWKYVVLFLFACLAVFGYLKKEGFVQYISNKAKHLSQTIVPKLSMKDVRYTLSEPDQNNLRKITITGKITNEDTVVAKFSGIECSLFDADRNKIKSWTEKLEKDFVMAGDSFDFATSTDLENVPNEIKVEVAIF